MSALATDLRARLEAHEPPEARGDAAPRRRAPAGLEPSGRLDRPRPLSRPAAVPRARRSGRRQHLGDASGRLPATRADGEQLELRLSTPARDQDPERFWIVELRRGDAPFGGVAVDEQFELPGGGTARILAPYAGVRLWLARLDLPLPLEAYLEEHGQPIRYGYVPRRWPLSAYQNVYAVEPGSAEMASAGRPFTAELITELVAGGVLVAPIILHTGVSSQERHERPYPERYRVPEHTARLVNAVHGWGGRVIATGTTVVRALETVARPDGDGRSPARGGRISSSRRSEVSGPSTACSAAFTRPDASHLDLLSAAAGPELLARSYQAAIEHGYRWHEFGDSHLILAS